MESKTDQNQPKSKNDNAYIMVYFPLWHIISHLSQKKWVRIRPVRIENEYYFTHKQSIWNMIVLASQLPVLCTRLVKKNYLTTWIIFKVLFNKATERAHGHDNPKE